MEKIRAFLAADFGVFYQQELECLIRSLRRKIPQVRWAAPGKVHLTIHFFGEIDPERMTSAEAGIRRGLKGFLPMDFSLKGFGAFPSMRAPRVFWVGLEGGNEELIRLKQSVDRELDAEGFLIEQRAFRPHLTIGRARGRTVTGTIPEPVFSFSVPRKIRMQELILYRSDLSRDGASHTPLYVFKIGTE